jgi:23S rRNA pseudouridine955/2504/2580 synthase
MNDLSKDAVNWLVVGDEAQGQRIDNFLVRILKGVPKSHIYRILRSGEVRVNRRKVGPDTRLAAGDRLRVPPIRATAPANRAGTAPAGTGSIPPILFEDAALIALDKPSGLAVHGGSGISYGLIERLRQARPEAKFLELVHRLDRDTSGVLLVAKKRLALTGLHAQLREGRTDKRYLVLVRGKWRDAVRTVELALERFVTGEGERRVRVERDGRTARTVFRLLQKWPSAEPPVALLEAELDTGRTHQIRVHLSAIGHPIVGDSLYGGVHRRVPHPLKAVTRLARPFLHAERLVITHPRTKERMEFTAPIPADLEAIAYELAPPEIRETVFARVSIAEETHHDVEGEDE